MRRLSHSLAALALVLSSAACTSATKDPNNGAVRPYPLQTCIVTDNALGSMGDPITRVYEGQEIKFCCKPCVAEFEADPAAFLAKLKQ